MTSELEGKVQTIRGPVDPAQLGITLIHEHLLFDLSCYYQPPNDSRGMELAQRPVELSTLGWIRQHVMNSRENLRMQEEETAAAEVELFRKLGGGAVVDQTTRGLSPLPEALARLSARTGVHIVAGTGYYIYSSHPPEVEARSIEELAREMTSDILKGFEGGSTRAGLIGEIGASWPLHPNEERCLRAAARAHHETGAAISIHPGHHADSPLSLLRTLQEEGVNPSRVVMSHIENRYREQIDLYKELAGTGCNLSFDTFGRDLYFASVGRQHPSDDLRIEVIAELVRSGYSSSILLAQDCCFRIDLTRFGGHGYAHILENILPRFRRRGIPEDTIQQMLVTNPQRVLTISKVSSAD